MDVTRTALLQWGRVVADAEGRACSSTTTAPARSFNGAASLPTRKACPELDPARPLGCFNGAASLPTRKVDHAAQRRGHRGRASMGPRRCRRGRQPAPGVRGVRRVALQWGRVVADAEGGPIARRRCEHDRLQWGRVVADAEGSRPSCRPRRRSASMGPRRCRRGRTFRRVLTKFPTQLQWGRVVADAEGVGVGGVGRDPDLASMGPRRCRRGRSLHSRSGGAKGAASMGPRRCRRGRPA